MHCISTFVNISTSVSSTVVTCLKHVWEEHKTALFTTVVVAAAIKLHHSFKKSKMRKEWDSAGENVVVVHGHLKATTCPNLSPYVLKLETYLRMAGIKYQFNTQRPWGPKGKMPWITLNGEDYTDSQLIIELLRKKFKKNFSSHLSEEQKGIARAMLIMTDEHIFWGFPWWRLIKDPESRIYETTQMPWFMRMHVIFIIKGRYEKMMWAQGLGRHSDDEIVAMIKDDIEALSRFLGNKPFLMGDTPCEVDCAVFGMIAQCVWGMPGSPFEDAVKSEYKNLKEYCMRMKEKFWPDWESCLLK